MTHRSYSCDLCKDPIRDHTDGIGLSFSRSVVTDSSPDHHVWEVKRHLHETERHLCRRCLNGLPHILRQCQVHLVA